MRKALNDNPVAQIAVLGVLAVIVAFLLMSRAGHSGQWLGGDLRRPGRAAPADTTGATTSPSPALGDDSSKHRLRCGAADDRPPPARRPAPRSASSWPGPGFPRRS